MKKNDKIRIILLTASVILTVEILTAAVLSGFGVLNVSFGRAKGSPAVTNPVSAADQSLTPSATGESVTGSTTETTTGETVGEKTKDGSGKKKTTKKKTTTDKKTSSTAKKTTTTKKKTGDNDGGWVEGWY